MSRGGFRGPSAQQLGLATEDFRIYIDEVFKDFINQHNFETYEFSSDLNNVLRKYIHEKCKKLGLKSKSRGKEPNRTLTIFKKKETIGIESFSMALGEPSELLLQKARWLHKSRIYELPPPNNVQITNNNKRQRISNTSHAFGRLFLYPKTQIPKPAYNHLTEFRKNLPVYKFKMVILEAIEKYNLVIVSAETGSGKTTQIAQYLLEDAHHKNQCVKVICTQPRRLSTVAVADRVAAERGEKIGDTVGYQIKLESKLGPRCSLVYCTNGVLLRTLMSKDESFDNVTHIIVDEIHERDKYTDFLLICLREALTEHPNLKIILMSATMEMELFKDYFKSHTEIGMLEIPGRKHQITSWFLEDILLEINYENQSMKKIRELREKNGSKVRRDQIILTPQVDPTKELDWDTAKELNETISNCFNVGSEELFTHLMQMILTESVSPNYQETDELKTPLMAAAVQGNLEVLEQLLNLGADPFLSCTNGITASGYAQKNNQLDVVQLLAMYSPQIPAENRIATCEMSQILADYDRTVRDDTVDYELVSAVVKYIHTILEPGAVLVFLPGYDDLTMTREKILKSGINPHSVNIFLLHGSMQIGAQHDVFTKMPDGKRKIVLSTNLAETSLTIDDVRYVVDSGKSKQKSYDVINQVSSLRTEWISMASAAQRAGRAGRTANGTSFHLYSRSRYSSLPTSTTPEILRVPLHELCLQVKLLAPYDMSIESFLNYAIEPPSSAAVSSSINVLKTLGALDPEENLTQLGSHLVQLSIEPYLGKMLLYSIIFKCLDPVLTIVSCLAHKDPFVLPSFGQLKAISTERRRLFTEDSLSDHMAFLRAFQKWQEAKVHHQVPLFCEENFVSASTMELILMTRGQLLSQLRALGFVQANNSRDMSEVNANAGSWPLVKACLAAGLYPNVAFYNDKKLHTRTEKFVQINMSSCLKNSEFNDTNSQNPTNKCWLIFEEISKNNMKCSIKCATAITPLTVALMCGLQADKQEDGSVIIDEWYELNFYNRDISQMRTVIESLIKKKIDTPQYKMQSDEDNTIVLLVQLLSLEDTTYGLKCPKNIGQRPRLLESRPAAGERYNPHNRNRGLPAPSRCEPMPGPSHYHHQQGGNRYDGNKFENNRFENNRYDNYRHDSGGHDRAEGSNGYDRYETNRYENNGRYYDGFDNRLDNRPRRNNQNWRFEDPSAGQLSQENNYPDLFPAGALYFIIRPSETKNIDIGMQQSVWNFAPQTEKKLFQQFLRGYVVILIFIARGSNFFQGVAKLISTNDGHPNQPCQIEWLTRNKLNLTDVKRYINQKIHVAVDGFQLQSDLGQKLSCQIYDSIDRSGHHRPILGKMQRR